MTTYLNPALKQAGAGDARPAQSKVTDFRRDLAASMDAERNPLVLAAIRQWFPRHLAVHRAHKENDYLGVDVWVEQPMARMTAVDLKIRSIDYAWKKSQPMDVALEINYGNGPGWAVKSTATDVYLFVCTDTGRSAAFDAGPMREALEINLDLWRGKYKMLTTWTGSYAGEPVQSTALCVPSDVLEAACRIAGARP
jgi:hypothetical protein